MADEITKLRKRVHSRVRDTLEEAIRPFSKFMNSQAHTVLAVMLHPAHCRSVPDFIHKIVQTIPEYEQETKVVTLDRVLSPYIMKLSDLVAGLRTDHLRADSANDGAEADFASLLGTSGEVPDEAKAEYKRFLTAAGALGNTSCENVLQWWKNHQQHFPKLSKIALHILGIPGSQIACERVFSQAGIITRHHRSRTQIGMIDTVMFVNVNLPQKEMLGSMSMQAQEHCLKGCPDDSEDCETGDDSGEESDSDDDRDDEGPGAAVTVAPQAAEAK